MINRVALSSLIVTVFSAFVATTAVAHRLPVVVTTVHVTDSGQIDVTHRVHAHDAISILSLDTDVLQPEVTSLRSRAKFALYVSEHFSLGTSVTGMDPDPLKLEILGAELEGDYLYVYQQAVVLDRSGPLYIKSDLLSTLGANWLSHVNFETGGEIQTITFSGKPSWKKAQP